MKQKIKANKKVIVICSIVIAVLIGVIAFISLKPEKLQQAKNITVCIDESLDSTLGGLEIYYNETIDHFSDFKFTTIVPTEKEAREMAIKKIRTELMAGNGQDLYIMSDALIDYETGERLSPFIENVNKSMSSGVWADLTKFTKKDKSFKQCFEPVMNAGKYNGRQYIIPLTFTNYMLKIPNDSVDKLSYDLKDVDTPIAKLIDEGKIDKFISYNFLCNPQTITGDIVNYEKGKLDITKEEIRELLEYAVKNFEENYNVGSVNIGSVSDYRESLLNAKQNHQYYPMFTLNGKPSARVTVYGAVSKSCKYKEEAYKYLSLILNKDYMSGYGMKSKVSDHYEGDRIHMVPGIPVNKESWETWYTESLYWDKSWVENYDKRNKEKSNFTKGLEAIESCQFNNSFDRQAYKVRELFIDTSDEFSKRPKNYLCKAKVDFPDIEQRIDKATDIIYDNLYYSAVE